MKSLIPQRVRRALPPRTRRGYGIALVLIVAVIGGSFVVLTTSGLAITNSRYKQIADRRTARAAIQGAVDRLATNAAEWLGSETMERSWTVSGFTVEARLVPVSSAGAFPQNDSIGYRGLEISATPIDYPDGSEEDARARRRGRHHTWGLTRTFDVAAVAGQPPLFLLYSEATIEPRKDDEGESTDAESSSATAATETAPTETEE